MCMEEISNGHFHPVEMWATYCQSHQINVKHPSETTSYLFYISGTSDAQHTTEAQ